MELNVESVVPQFDRVLVKVEKAETKTPSGIVLPNALDSKFRKGVIKAVGPGKRLENGEFAGVSLAKDQVVIFGAYSGIEIDEKNGLVLVNEDEVYATLS